MLQSAPAIQGTCVTTLALLPGKALFAWPQTRSCILEDFGDGDSRLMRFWLFQENHQIRENASIQIIKGLRPLPPTPGFKFMASV